MNYLKCVVFIFAAFCVKFILSETSCETRVDAGQIADSVTLPQYMSYKRCWTVHVPPEKYAAINVTTLITDVSDVSVYSEFSLTVGQHILNPPLERNFASILLRDGNITFSAKNLRNNFTVNTEFHLNYKVESLVCTQKDSFRCSETECVTQSHRCNGVKNCENGADEENCDSDNGFEIEGLKETLENALGLLKGKMFITGGWGEYTPDAVIAIYLATGTNFSRNTEERHIVKYLENVYAQHKDTEDLTKLAIYINALLACGLNPANFLGEDIVIRLEMKVHTLFFVDSSNGLAYLALCNANVDLTRDIKDIKALLTRADSSNSDKYYVAMAIDCLNRRGYSGLDEAKTQLEKIIRELKKSQRVEGSFFDGIINSAKTVQAIMASNASESKDWNYKAAITYLMQFMDYRVDLVSILHTIPVLANRTLVDIGFK